MHLFVLVPGARLTRDSPEYEIKVEAAEPESIAFDIDLIEECTDCAVNVRELSIVIPVLTLL